MKTRKNYLVKLGVFKEGKYTHDIFLEFQIDNEEILRDALEKQLIPALEGLFNQEYQIVEIKEV